MDADEAENRVELSYGDNYKRLASIKAKYDPDNLFRSTRTSNPTREPCVRPTRRKAPFRTRFDLGNAHQVHGAGFANEALPERWLRAAISGVAPNLGDD
jgi:hypothetical protein